MVFSTIYRSLVTRLIAAFIIALVVSPYSEPFATIDGTNFGGAGAVDVVDVSKSKSKVAEEDMLAVPPFVTVVMLDVTVAAARPLLSSLTLDSRRAQHAILRL
jgi:hypothetical protein